MIPAPIDDPALEARFAALPPDGMTVFTLGGAVRGALLHGTRMVNLMRANHGLGPLETLVLGRAYLLAGLLSATIKGKDRLAFRVDGDGPAAGLSVEAGADGSVRGYLLQSPLPLEATPEGESPPSLAQAAFGSGALTMTRIPEGLARPFSGTVALSGAGLAKDLARYYLESEQTRTAFDAGIQFDRSGRAIGAGALYLQALPGAEELFLAEVEEAMGRLPPLGLWFSEGGTRDAFLSELLAPFAPERLGEKRVAFNCGCSREGFVAFLEAGKREILRDLAEKGPWPAEVCCHNCGSVYRFPQAELEALRDSPSAS
jgi:molecular chaperone Hsp33